MTGAGMTTAAPGAATPPLGLAPEAAGYTLTLGGRFAGTQEWVIRPDRGALAVRVQTDFGGALPAGRTLQESRFDPQRRRSLGYAEAEGHTRRPHFETLFDAQSGLITLRQGKDEASIPLVQDHQDPVSLLLWLRSPPWDTSGLEVGATEAGGTARLVGGPVQVLPLPLRDGGEVGGVPARGYLLRPGGIIAWVEREAPHRLLLLQQPSEPGLLEARLDLGAPPRSRRDDERPASQTPRSQNARNPRRRQRTG